MSDHWTTFDSNHPACREEATTLLLDWNCMFIEPPKHAKVKGEISIENWKHDASCLNIVGEDADWVRNHIMNSDPDIVAKIYKGEWQ